MEAGVETPPLQRLELNPRHCFELVCSLDADTAAAAERAERVIARVALNAVLLSRLRPGMKNDNKETARKKKMFSNNKSCDKVKLIYTN